MISIDFFIVDVFALEKYSGNQLAVFVDLAQKLSTEQMLQITREINFAESTFIRTIEEDGSFGVRIFTTEYEVPFAGHPTLGTSYIIAKHLLEVPKEELVLRLKKGDIPVQVSDPERLNESRFTMQQVQPEFGKTYDCLSVSDMLGISWDVLDTTMPIQEINTGLPYLIIFLNDLKSIQNLKLNVEKVTQFLKQEKLHKGNNVRGLSTSLFFVTSETEQQQNDYHTRMFALENDTLWEDAATGSANGCFLAYLLKHKNQQQSVIVEQGYEMERNSILYLDGSLREDKYVLKVGGQVVPISEGKWNLYI